MCLIQMSQIIHLTLVLSKWQFQQLLRRHQVTTYHTNKLYGVRYSGELALCVRLFILNPVIACIVQIWTGIRLFLKFSFYLPSPLSFVHIKRTQKLKIFKLQQSQMTEYNNGKRCVKLTKFMKNHLKLAY